MRKLLSVILILFSFVCLSCEAKLKDRNCISIIKNSGISTDSISISVKNVETGRTLYSLNSRILMHPASIQKILTIVPVMEVLGEDYKFSTELYSSNNDTYTIKLGADPYLSTHDIQAIVSKINSDKIKKLYIDDSIIEQKDWGEGWQWDDDLNTYMPRFNSYNLDGNIIQLTVMPTNKNSQALIINPSKYPLAFYNYVVTGDKNDVTISRDNLPVSNAIKLEGTINKPLVEYIPNNNLKRYFEVQLKNALEDEKIYLNENLAQSKIKDTDKKVAEVTHSVEDAQKDILKNSNNMVIETMAKLAGGKYFNKQGTDIDGIKLFYMYCEKNNIDKTRIKMVDASGVSKNNLINADFVTEFLIKNKDNKTLAKMMTPGEGTLSNRLIPLKNNIQAKTGTLSDISSIAGFLTAKNGKKYAFCIIINDPSSKSVNKKSLEDYLIREFYLNL